MALYQRDEIVRDFNGVVVSRAFVKVVTGQTYSDLAPLATLYADSAGLVPLDNPFQADAAGRYVYWVDAGYYSEQITRPNYLSETSSGFFVGAQQGDPGPTGPTGATGPQGATGATGPAGTPGFDPMPFLADTTDPAKGAALIGYKSSLAYAAGTVGAKLKQSICPLDAPYNCVGNGIADDSTGMQAALSSGKNIDLMGHSYAVNNLTHSTNVGWIYSSTGIGKLIKNANGPILTSSGDDFTMQNVQWLGDSATPTFTGHGVVSSGQRPAFLNCAGQWITGRVLLATGGRVRIKACCAAYQTTDLTATGYDVEIGLSGTNTAYHELDEVYTSQATGGILLTDTGEHVIKGGQFGKLSILKGTGPAGSGGGKTIGARILGDVTVGLSSAQFSCNKFGAIVITFQAGTSGCSLDVSNVLSNGHSIVNSGNANNLIIRNVSTGSVTQLRFGADAAYRDIILNPTDPTNGYLWDASHVLPNTRKYQVCKADGITKINVGSVDSNDKLQAGDLALEHVLSGLVVYFVTPAGTQAKVIDGVFAPFSDNAKSLGSTSLRWTITYTGNVLLTQAATSGGAGTIALGGTHASTVGAAGAASALPATPLGYMIANVDGTQVKIPYYNT